MVLCEVGTLPVLQEARSAHEQCHTNGTALGLDMEGKGSSILITERAGQAESW